MKIVPFDIEKHSKEWDDFIAACPMATFLHSRKFLSYHKDKFQDCSLMMYGDEGLEAVLPAALDPKDAKRVVSHPGITYGGLLTQGIKGGNEIRELFTAIFGYYQSAGKKQFVYKAIPSFYHRAPSETDEWVLTALGARIVRTDLSRVINLKQDFIWGDPRRRGVTKSKKAGIELAQGQKFADSLWAVTQDNLARKHAVVPVHSLDDIHVLVDTFPSEIDYIVALLEGKVVAGAMLFITPSVVHVQYGSSSEKGYETGALETVYYRAIEWAKEQGKDYFSFGISTEQEGKVLNETLDMFKKKFSAGGAVYRFYALEL
ncbi:MAG: GNAT family N-acetyltransferase [Proteobacteria bacterium]|nr:GNAT family N-acetyltransferase [Pseudomonadota bacterium]